MIPVAGPALYDATLKGSDLIPAEAGRGQDCERPLTPFPSPGMRALATRSKRFACTLVFNKSLARAMLI